MFEGLLENMKEQEAALRQKLSETIVEEELHGIKITGNANLDITSLNIDDVYLDIQKKEELEDIMVACLSNWKIKAEAEANNLSAGMVEGIIPPGLDDLFNQMK